MALSTIGRNQLNTGIDDNSDATAITIDSSENVGVGTTSPVSLLHLEDDTPVITLRDTSAYSAGTGPYVQFQGLDSGSTNRVFGQIYGLSNGSNSGELAFYTRNSGTTAERMRIDSSGNVGIGMTPSRPLHVQASSGAASIYVRGRSSDGTATMLLHEDNSGNAQNSITGYTTHLRIDAGTTSDANHSMQFYVNDAERMRLDANGNIFHGKTSSSISTEGALLYADGRHYLTKSSDDVIICNRLTDDGKVIRIFQDSSEEGHISVSGSTVSFNGGHLARLSQAADGNRISGLVKRTVMTNLDQMAVWSHAEVLWTADDELPDGVSVGDVRTAAYTEQNEQLNCMAVSSVEGDTDVAGVFVNFDDEDTEFTADMNIAMTGDMVIRIAQGTTVARGDLLMSAGDGTAKPQGDDIVRSKTIAKVTSTTVSHTYEDGSYLVPCVLMAC